MGDLALLAATGIPGIAVVGYVVFRVVDRVLDLIGLRMVLRATRRADRVSAITAYRDKRR